MRKLVLGMALASSAMASPALARDGAWYVEVDGGVMIVEDNDFDLFNANDAVTGDYRKGYDFGGIVGHDFGAIRLEAEGSYRSADLRRLTANTAAGVPGATTVATTYNASGDANVLSFMANALLDFGPSDGLQGFVGAGVGVARTKFDNVRTNVSGPGFLDDSDTSYAWQVLAGVRAPLTDTIDVGVKYRFFNTSDINLVAGNGQNVQTRLRTHSLLGTIGFNFGGAPAPMQTCWDGTQLPMDATCPARPVEPTPEVTPTPEVVCNKGPYIVFFDWDKSDITAEASTVLNNAVSAYANCGSASVMLAGYADTSGSSQYNVGLSQRRADAVRGYVSSRGVPDASISTEAFGETNLRVPTADGVRELQNRRVEITYGPNSGM